MNRNPAAHVRQTESGPAVAAVDGAQQRKQGVILRYGQ
jgi:hypothetical protein